MATYGTDLVLLASGSDAESGTWVEMASPYNAGGGPGIDPENFIQGSNSQSQTMGNKFTVGKSVAFDAGSDISGSFATDDVVMAWVFFQAGSNLYDYATTGGHRFGIAADTAGLPSTSMDMWFISGDDRSPNPEGGWWNVAVDPTFTPDAVTGGGNGGVYWYFGSILEGMRAQISKGTPHAVDVMRFGRGEIYCTGASPDASFTLMAAQNDLNANKWGLLKDTGGDTFLWKGLMSIGQVGTSTTFVASNQTIVIDDTAKVYQGFNKLEIRHASTSVTLTNISFTAKGTVSPGQFEMVENAATMSMAGCTFNNMDTFIFLSNGILDSCNFIGCSTITHGGADFEACTFEGYEFSANTSYLVYDETADPNGELDNCNFTKGTIDTHAIEFGLTSPLTMTLTGCDFQGYSATQDVNSSIFHFKRTTGTITLNLVGCSSDVSFTNAYRTDGATIVIVVDPVTTLITVQDIDDATFVNAARVIVQAFSGGTENWQETVSIVNAATTATVTHTAHGLATSDLVNITGADLDEYNGVKTITVTDANTYTYTTSGSPTSPAAGTPVSTTVYIDGDTDVNGEISFSKTFGGDQPIRGRVRRATTGKLYKTSPINSVIDSSTGLNLGVLMISDE